nr:PREDICTED: uncharacterized protein LOC103972248 [Musa acuminata subsp. malaccensis]
MGISGECGGGVCPVDESLELAGLVEAADLVGAAKAAASEEDLREGGPMAAWSSARERESTERSRSSMTTRRPRRMERTARQSSKVRRTMWRAGSVDDAAEDVGGGVFVGVVMDDGLEVPEVGGGGRAEGPHKIRKVPRSGTSSTCYYPDSPIF